MVHISGICNQKQNEPAVEKILYIWVYHEYIKMLPCIHMYFLLYNKVI